jgi:hypothetical protein
MPIEKDFPVDFVLETLPFFSRCHLFDKSTLLYTIYKRIGTLVWGGYARIKTHLKITSWSTRRANEIRALESLGLKSRPLLYESELFSHFVIT